MFRLSIGSFQLETLTDHRPYQQQPSAKLEGQQRTRTSAGPALKPWSLLITKLMNDKPPIIKTCKGNLLRGCAQNYRSRHQVP